MQLFLIFIIIVFIIFGIIGIINRLNGADYTISQVNLLHPERLLKDNKDIEDYMPTLLQHKIRQLNPENIYNQQNKED